MGPAEQKGDRTVATVSRRLDDGTLIELVYTPRERRTALAIHAGGKSAVLDSHLLGDGTVLVPIKATNNLVRHRCVLLPSTPEPYGELTALVASIREYLHQYIDLSRDFEDIATYYVILTWVYDAFNELPYLRLRGDYGSGKTRALLVIGSICYKPFFASGASTVSPIFHALDTFQGTLVFDETDFRFSDEKAELVKIFNSGNVKGFPVLRTSVTPNKEFDPRAFSVFGPKIVAMRRSFDDQALESRFLTEDMGKRPLRSDIPINLPDEQQEEALSLRNRLLSYRFATLEQARIDTAAYDERLSPRLNQIIAPLLAVVDDEKVRVAIRHSLQSLEEGLEATRAASPEADVLEIVLALAQTADRDHLPIAEITESFIKRFGKEYDRPITPRYVGHLIRNRLRLTTYKRHGSFVVPLLQKEHLAVLARRYGMGEGGHGEVGTSEGAFQG